MLVPTLTKTKIFSSVLRNVCLTSYHYSNEPVQSNPPPQSNAPNPSTISRKLYAPTNIEKRMLVWTGRFKRTEDIPPELSMETIERARNRSRIKVANYTMVVTLILCVLVSISGKRAAERGDSLSKRNEEWHKEMNKIKQ